MSKRTIYRLVDRGQIPAVRVGGQWRFPRSAVDYWLDLRLNRLGAVDLDALEADPAGPSLSLAGALAEPNALIPLQPGPVLDVIRSLVAGMQFPEPVDREVVIERLAERESLCSTAMPGGIAVLHTARWGPRVLRGSDVVAVGRLSEPIDFGALDGTRTDLIVPVLARNERHHLVLLTKMTRLCREDSFIAALRSAGSAAEVAGVVARHERAVFQPRPVED